MATNSCLQELLDKANGVLNYEQVSDLLELALNTGRAKASIKGPAAKLADVEEEFFNSLDKIVDNEVKRTLLAKRHVLLQQRALTNIREVLKLYPNSTTKGLEAILVGDYSISRNDPKYRRSVHSAGQAYTNGWIGKFINSLRKNDLLDALISGKFDEEIIHALWGNGKTEPKISKETDNVAQSIAKRILAMQDEIVRRLNLAGASITTRKDFVFNQSHDMIKIRKAGLAQWKADVANWIAPDFNFGAYNSDEFYKIVFDGLSTGVFGPGSRAGEWASMHNSPSEAARLSHSRELRFKSADAFIAYNKKYGKRSLTDSLLQSAHSGGRSLALMEAFGPNPKETILRIINEDMISLRGTNPAEVDRLRTGYIDDLVKVVTGEFSIPSHAGFAKWSNINRQLHNASKLGSAVFASMTDIPATIATLSMNGVSYLDAWPNQLSAIFRGRTKGEKRELADLIGAGIGGLTGDIMNRFSSANDTPGKMSYFMQKFFTLNGMSYWNDSMLTAVGHMLSNNLGNNAHKPFDALHSSLQRTLSEYGITPKEWEFMSKHAVKEFDGRKYFLPDLVFSSGLENYQWTTALKDIYGLTSLHGHSQQRLMDSMVDKFNTYYTDQMFSAVPHPDAKVQYWTSGQGARPGTPVGEAMRFVTQFKAFPISFMRRAVQPMIARGNWGGLAHLILMMTLFGGISQSLKNLSRGQTPPDFTKPKNIMAAMVAGGGFGLYGDFLFGEWNRYGNNLVESMMGPTATQFADLGKMLAQTWQGKFNAGMLARIVYNTTPGVNLFYTRALLDFHIGYQLMEELNPGYKRRMKARLKEQGSSFIVEP